MWGKENFVESFYGVGWDCLCSVLLLTSLSLTFCLSMSFNYFLKKMKEKEMYVYTFDPLFYYIS